MEDGLVALRIVFVDFGNLLGRRGGFGQGLQFAESNPGVLLAAGLIDDKQADIFAVLLELVLDLALEGKRLRLGHVDAGVFEILAVVDANGD